MQNMFFCPLILVISGKNGLMPTFLCNALVGGWSLLQVMARLKVGAAAIWVFLIIPCAELLHTPEVFTAGFLPVLNIWARIDDTQRSLKNAGMIPSTGRLDVCWSKWLGSEKSEKWEWEEEAAAIQADPHCVTWGPDNTHLCSSCPSNLKSALLLSYNRMIADGLHRATKDQQFRSVSLYNFVRWIVQTNPPYPNTEEGKTEFLES